VLALVRIGAAACARRWIREARALTIFGLAGFAVAAVDLQSATRTRLWLALLATCVVAGAARPRLALPLGLLIGLGLPVATAVIGYGPYASDRGDIWYPMLPALMVTVLTANLMCRSRPRT
jgi:hypothetical protein